MPSATMYATRSPPRSTVPSIPRWHPLSEVVFSAQSTFRCSATATVAFRSLPRRSGPLHQLLRRRRLRCLQPLRVPGPRHLPACARHRRQVPRPRQCPRHLPAELRHRSRVLCPRQHLLHLPVEVRRMCPVYRPLLSPALLPPFLLPPFRVLHRL